MLEQALTSAIADHRAVGAISVVMHQGRVIHERALGFADLETGREMTVTTPHRLASFTKPVTALATLALVDRGKLSLDDRAARWVELDPRITIHQLLTHTAGLGYSFTEGPDGPYHRARVSNGLDQPGLSVEENLRRLASVPLIAEPGTAWNYSMAFDVLGAIIEKLVDAPFDRAIAKLVTEPLGLDLSFGPPDGLATPYWVRDGQPVKMTDGVDVPAFPPNACTFAPSRVYDPRSYPSGGAGINGTAREFARFLEALRTRITPVRAELVDQMFRDQIPSLGSPMLAGFGATYGAAILREGTPSPLERGAIRWGGAYGHAWFISGETVSVLLTGTAFDGMNGKLRDEVEVAVRHLVRDRV